MAVKYEKTINASLSGKGILTGVTDNVIQITDEKEGNVDEITFGDIRDLFLNKSITFKIATKEPDSQ